MLPASTIFVRGETSDYAASLTLSLDASLYDVVEPVTGFSNYKVYFLYSSSDITTYQQFFSSRAQNETKIDTLNSRKGIGKNSQASIDVNVTASPTDSECEQTKYICFALTNTNGSSYNDTKQDDNVKCLALASNKQCFPGKETRLVNFYNHIRNFPYKK